MAVYGRLKAKGRLASSVLDEEAAIRRYADGAALAELVIIRTTADDADAVRAWLRGVPRGIITAACSD